MGRVDDLLTLEAAGELPAHMQADLDTLRSAGEIPGGGGADMNLSAAPPQQQKKGLTQYIGDEFKAGVKEATSPSTAQYPGAETIGNFSPTLRNIFGSLLGASRAAYAVPTGLAQKYVTEPLKEGAAPYTPEQLAHMKQFEPGRYQAISQMTPEEQKAGQERAAETAGMLASTALTAGGTGLVRNAPNIVLRTAGRVLDPLASAGGINRPGALKDALEARSQGIADATGNLSTAKTELQQLIDRQNALKAQQGDILTNIGQQQRTLRDTRPVMPTAPDVSGVNLADTVTQAAPGKIEAGQQFGKVIKGETKRLYAQSSKNYENIAKQFGDEVVPQAALQPIVDEAVGLEGELRGVPATKRVAMQIPPGQEELPAQAIEPPRPRPAPLPIARPAAPTTVEPPTSPTYEAWVPRPSEAAPAPPPPRVTKIEMGKSGFRGDPQVELTLAQRQAQERARIIEGETMYPEGGSSNPSEASQQYARTYLSLRKNAAEQPPAKPTPRVPAATGGAASNEPAAKIVSWINSDKDFRTMPRDTIEQLSRLEQSGQLTTDTYRQVIANMLTGEDTPAVNVNKLIRLDQVLSEAGRSYGNSGNIAARSAIRQMQGKVQDALSQTGAAEALGQAKAFHAQISELVGPDSLAQKVFNLKPDQVVSNVFLPGESGTRPNISMIRDAKKIYTAQNPEAWRELTGSALKQLQGLSSDINTGTLDAQKFHRNWARYGETFKEALEPDQYLALKGIDATIARYNIDTKTALKAMRENRTATMGLKETAQDTKAQFGPDLSQLQEQIRGQKGTVSEAQKQLNQLSQSAKSGMRSGISNPYMWMAIAQVGQALQATFTANWAGAGRQLAQGVVWYTIGNPMYLEKLMGNKNLSKALAVVSGVSRGAEEGTRNARYVRMLLDDIRQDMEQNQGQQTDSIPLRGAPGGRVSGGTR